jgi:microcystin-dependent protein
MAWLFTRYRFSFPINERKTNKTSSCMLSASTKNNTKTTTQETRCVENTPATHTHDTATGSYSLCMCLGSSKPHANFRSRIILDQNLPSCQGSQGTWVSIILHFRNEHI